MAETALRNTHQSETGWHTTYTFTRSDVDRLGLDPDLHDALALIRIGIQDTESLNGVKDTREWQQWYGLLHPARYSKGEKKRRIGYDHSKLVVPLWEHNFNKGRESVMIAERNENGIAGAVDFRKYQYAGKPAIYVHWVGVKYDSRRMGVGTRLYTAMINHAEGERIELVMAGVNPHNEASVRLHKKLGFIHEVGNPTYPFAVRDRNRRLIRGITEVYSLKIPNKLPVVTDQ